MKGNQTVASTPELEVEVETEFKGIELLHQLYCNKMVFEIAFAVGML